MIIAEMLTLCEAYHIASADILLQAVRLRIIKAVLRRSGTHERPIQGCDKKHLSFIFMSFLPIQASVGIAILSFFGYGSIGVRGVSGSMDTL